MFDYCKYEIAAGFWEGNTPIVCNLQWYNSLPADLQQLVVSTYSNLEAQHYANYDQVIKTDRDQVLKAGVNIYNLPDAEFQRWVAAIKPITDDWAKKYGADWQKFLDSTKLVRRW
jgi:TRAP-type C4-dicarboxylate transport system substrate-binding protein